MKVGRGPCDGQSCVYRAAGRWRKRAGDKRSGLGQFLGERLDEMRPDHQLS